MECEEIKELIPQYIHNDTSPEELMAVEEHLSICSGCRQYLGRLMDKPGKILGKERRGTASGAKIGLWDYIVLIIGATILTFFIYLLLKG